MEKLEEHEFPLYRRDMRRQIVYTNDLAICHKSGQKPLDIDFYIDIERKEILVRSEKTHITNNFITS